MISTKNISQAKEQIKKSTASPIIIKAQSAEFNRKLLEYGKFHILSSLESVEEKDKLKRTGSGFNHVLARIASKNKIAIGIDLRELSSLKKKEKAIRLARIKQNIKICRKANCKIKLLNIKNEKNAKAFLQSLGASSQQVIESTINNYTLKH